MCIHCSCSNNFLNFGSLYFQSGALGDPDNLLPLDKIPTNEFIEKFLEDDSSESGKKESSSTNMKRAESKPKIKVDPLPDISDDDLETVLDIEGKKTISSVIPGYSITDTKDRMEWNFDTRQFFNMIGIKMSLGIVQ